MGKEECALGTEEAQRGGQRHWPEEERTGNLDVRPPCPSGAWFQGPSDLKLGWKRL